MQYLKKKYPGYSLEIYNNEEFIVLNVLLMNTAELIKDYYRSKKIKMHPLTGELKRLKENLAKIVSDSKIVKNISESTYNELSEINDEIREELEIRARKLNLNHIGYVRDLSSSTSEHLGVIYYIDTGSVFIREKDKFEGRWISYDELKEVYYGKLESWSRYSIDYLYESEIFHNLLNF